MAKIETIRFNGRTTSEVRKQYRHWYEDNRAKVSIVNEHEIERLRLETGGPQHRPLGREDAYTMLVEYEHKARAASRSNPSTDDLTDCANSAKTASLHGRLRSMGEPLAEPPRADIGERSTRRLG